MKELRRRKLLTQKELADAIGVEYQTVQRWENGSRHPRPAQLRRLVEALGVTPDELLAALEETEANAKDDGVKATDTGQGA